MSKIKVNPKQSSSDNSNYPIYYAFIAKGCPYAKRYYDTFRSDHKISIRHAEIISHPTYFNLLQRINNISERNILIFSHGNSDAGMTSFSFIEGEKNVKSYEGLFYILRYAAVERIYSNIKSSKNLDDWLDVLNIITKHYNTDNAESTLQELKDLGLYNNTQSEFNDEINGELKEYKKKPNEKRINELTKKWNGKILKHQEDIIKKLGLPPESKASQTWMSNFIKLISDIQNKKLNNIAIRGCNIGNAESLLEIYSIFFNAQKISAPTVKVFMGILKIDIFSSENILRQKVTAEYNYLFGTKPDPTMFDRGTKGFSRTKKISGPQTKQVKQMRFGEYYNPLDLNLEKNRNELFISLIVNIEQSTGTGRIVAENIQIVEIFAQNCFGKATRPIRREIPVYFLPDESPIFPKNDAFNKLLSNKTYIYYNFINDYQ